jgi:predicted  nucleic acid-binding Zn-ribbon protein
MPEPSLDTLLQAIQQVQSTVGQFREEQTLVREELTRMRVDIMARTERLQDDVTNLRDDAFVTFARAERVERATRETTNGIGQELSGMHRQIRRLQDEVRILRGEHGA